MPKSQEKNVFYHLKMVSIRNEKIQEFVLNKIDVSKYEEIAEGYIAKLEKVIDDYILKEYEDQKEDVNNVNIKKTIGVIKKG